MKSSCFEFGMAAKLAFECWAWALSEIDIAVPPHLPLRASECTQPCMRDLALAMSSLLKKSSGRTLVDRIDRAQEP
jgi:hypothetical protein